MQKHFRSRGKRTLAALLTGLLTASLFNLQPGIVAAATDVPAEAVTFKTQAGGIFDGMPLFDGVPAHLDAFVDNYYDYIGLEGAALYATGIRDNYTFVMDDKPAIKGKAVPGGLAAADNVFGISTDFPALIGMGQTWDKELLAQVGGVMGSEKISQLNVKQGTANIHNGANKSTPIAFTALADIRTNPLNGRLYEGYSEDPYLTATMVDGMAAGLAGTNQSVSEDGFWQRAMVGTKHFTLYSAEWFRQTSSTNASARAIYEYQTPPAYKGLASGSVGGIMTAFGRTNGIPNIISPYLILGNKMARYGMYSSPDFNGEQHLYNTSFSNGYNTSYTVDRKHALALMVLAHSESVRASGTDKTDVVTLANAVKEGLYGITLQDVREAGRPLVNQLVRLGIFNEVDSNGIPLYYPFASAAKDVSSSLTNYSTPAHQEVALQAANETVVLLKNTDNALPLSKNQKAAVAGVYADMRMRPGYATSTPNIDNSGKTPLYAILKTIGKDNVKFSTGAEIIALKSQLNDKYLTAGPDAGTQLAASAVSSANPLTDAQLFEAYDWGQSATSLKSKANNLWLNAPTANSASVANSTNVTLNLTHPDWSTPASLASNSTIPPKLRIEANPDQSVSLISGGLGFQTGVFNGRFLTTGTDDKIATAASTIGNLQGFNTRNANVKFDKTVVTEAGKGADIASMAETQDYALVFIGSHAGNSAGEGNDRSSLYLGQNDYKLVKNVAAAFAAKNKKTIVVLLTSLPVIMEDIQNDPNVSAIVTQPYSGQYEAQGLANVLYGDYAPTGRLSSTWYADMSAIQNIDSYSIPEGSATIRTLEQLDPRYTKDMSNADPIESKLTYMYTDAPVTYEFGYGLGYADFTYKDFVVPASAGSQGEFNVSVELTNEGAVTTSDIVQLYAVKQDSAYAGATPKKKLIAYEKAELTSGEHKVVTLTVDPQDLAVWDVNKGDYIIEEGAYTFMVGRSSENIKAAKDVNLDGESLSALSSAEEINIFDHSFNSQNVVYREASKLNTVESLTADKVAGEYYTVMSKESGAWVALPKADFSGAKQIVAKVGTDKAPGNITLRAGSPEAAPFAVIPVEITGATQYVMPKAPSQTVSEAVYKEVSVDLTDVPSGAHTVYVVFDSPNLRIHSIKVSETALKIAAPVEGTPLATGQVGLPYDQTLELKGTGGTAPYTWSVTGLPAGLSYDSGTSRIQGTPEQDTNSDTPYPVKITLTDANRQSVSVVTNLTIRQALGIKYPVSGGDIPAAKVGVAYSVYMDVYGGIEPYTWDISGLSAGLEFDPATRYISGTPALNTDSDSPYLITLQVKDANQWTAESTFSLTVEPGDDPGQGKELTIVSPENNSVIPGGKVGVAYNYAVPLVAEGGTQPYHWTAEGLPAGLHFNPETRVILGTPSADTNHSGPYEVLFNLTDGAGHSKSVTTILEIAPGDVIAALAITSPVNDYVLSTGTVGSSYQADLSLAASGGTEPYAWSISGLPAGLEFQPQTGRITGTPASAGDFTFTLTVKDSAQHSASVNVKLHLNSAYTPAPTAAPTSAPVPAPTPTPAPSATPASTATPTPTAAPTKVPATVLTLDQAKELAAAKFNDAGTIPDWAISAIADLVNRDIISGRQNGAFDHAGKITRAEFLKMVVTGFEFKAGAHSRSFTDVAANAWYTTFIDIATSNKLVDGIGNGKFGPNTNISRQDLSVMLVKALKAQHIPLPAVGSAAFPDNAEISPYAKEAVSILKTLGIVNGRTEGMFDPLAAASRAEAAVIIKGVLDYAAKQTIK